MSTFILLLFSGKKTR